MTGTSRMALVSFLIIGTTGCFGGGGGSPVSDAKALFEEGRTLKEAANQAEETHASAWTLGQQKIKWISTGYGTTIVDSCITTVEVEGTTYFTGQPTDCSMIGSRLNSLKKDQERLQKRSKKRLKEAEKHAPTLSPSHVAEYVTAVRNTPNFDFTGCMSDAKYQFSSIINAKLEKRCAAGTVDEALEKQRQILSYQGYENFEKLVKSMSPEEQSNWAQISTGSSESCLQLSLASNSAVLAYATQKIAAEICFNN